MMYLDLRWHDIDGLRSREEGHFFSHVVSEKGSCDKIKSVFRWSSSFNKKLSVRVCTASSFESPNLSRESD